MHALCQLGTLHALQCDCHPEGSLPCAVIITRTCRQLLRDVWRQFTNISSPVTSSVNLDLEYSREVSEVGEFEAPEAANTTILVVGGTGR